MSFSVRSAAAVALAAAAFAAFGCGETVIDDVKTEGAIKSNLEKSLDEKIASVECPSGREVVPKETFTCDVKYSDGRQATATLKIVNKDADLNFVGLKPNK